MTDTQRQQYRRMNEAFGQKKAPGYGNVKFSPFDVSGFKNYLREVMLLEAVAPRAGDTILDAGCAAGRQSLLMAERGARVIGMDISESFIVRANRERAARGGETAQFLVADIENLPFAPDSMDKILCAEILEHVIDFDAAFKELLRLLRPGGRLVMSVPNLNGEGTLWQRVKSFFQRKAFQPLDDFSLEAIEEHGDAHRRLFTGKSLRGLVRPYPVDVVHVRGCGIVDMPWYNRIIGYLLLKPAFQRLFLRLERCLSALGVFTALSRHLVVVLRKRPA